MLGMMGEWQHVQFADVIEIISGGTPKTSIPEYWNGGIPWLSVVDFNTGYRWVSGTEKTITQLGLSNSATMLLQRRDIILSARGTVGVLAQLTRPMAFNQSCYGIRGKEGITDTDFLYYALSNSVTKMKKVAHGGVFDTITRDTFKLLGLNLPSFPEQRAIAHILGILDDKIELNRKMNKTLEAMAQALFKSWFVDFDPVRAKVNGRWKYGESLAGLPAHFYDLFPIDLVPTENLGDVPKDWQVAKLGDIADVLNGFAFKSKDYLSSGIFVLRTKNFSDNGYAERLSDDVFLSSEFLTSHKSYLCEEFDFFLVMVGASIGKVSTLFSTCLPALRNQNMWCFRPKKDFSSRFYINHAVTRIIQLNSQIASGSARDFFRKEDFKKFYIIKPPVPVLDLFEKQVSSFYRRISVNHREISDLVCLRDSLLPRLISGELRIKDVEKIIGDAT